MSCNLIFEYTENTGRNPLHEKFSGEFEIDFDFLAGDTAHYGATANSQKPRVKLLHTRSVSATRAARHTPTTTDEKIQLGSWFHAQLGEDKSLRQRVKKYCVALVNFDENDHNLFD